MIFFVSLQYSPYYIFAMNKILLPLLLCVSLFSASSASAALPIEYLDRGSVALPDGDGMYISWRSLGRDGETAVYELYRNGSNIARLSSGEATNFFDAQGSATDSYEIRTLCGDSIVEKSVCTPWDSPYLKIHLDRPESGRVPGNDRRSHFQYRPNDISVGDVDGDGCYELFVKWEPSNAHDSAHAGYTGNTIFDCYRLDGTKLWRVDLGRNIRSGAHYTQFLVYDFDGDGAAEMICKTAPGTIDGLGNPVLLGDDKVDEDHRVHDTSIKAFGHIRGGSEYLTVFDGKTGRAIHTIPYRPSYYDVPEEIWGDEKCNRSDRYLAGVACVDGVLPSAIMSRGYYCGSFVWAVNFRDGKLSEAWLHKSDVPYEGLWGEGAHSLMTGDVDGDGCDEIIFGASALDHDGSLLYRTGGGHGDALHLGKFLPERPGLQVFMPHEEEYAPYPFDTSMRDAATGQILYSKPQSGMDVGRGLTADITDLYPGHEYWAIDSRKIYNHGAPVGNMRLPINFRIYWDGDLLDELLNGTSITKPDRQLTHLNTLVDFRDRLPVRACNGSKNTPCIQADILGDWREEVILRDAETDSDIYIFTTTIPTSHRLNCLMEDRIYRLAVAAQNVCYNQPPHLGYSPIDTIGK